MTEVLNPPELNRIWQMINAIREDIENSDDEGLFSILISIYNGKRDCSY